ncbi:MAG: PASTA domain-containing protein [Chloroflexota bacterium]
MRLYFSLILIVGLWIAVPATHAQDAPTTVPDLTGLNVPQAAAELNRAGLRLGVELGAAWTEASATPPNTVGGQSVAAGQTLAYGSEVDVTVLTTATLTLLYDDNDITLINATTAPLDTTGLTFNSADGTKFFSADEWVPVLDPGDCGQLWSITTRRDPKRLPECDGIQWLAANDTVKHFWTALAGVNEFSVVQGGVARATCPAAPAGTQPLRCDFALGGVNADTLSTPYLHFAYNANALAVINTSSDQWMPLDQTPIINVETGQQFGFQGLFTDSTIVADVTRLAPNQCILLTIDQASPPGPCDVVATVTVDAESAFWRGGFLLDTATTTDNEMRSCPMPDSTRSTLCIMPR